MDAANPKGAGEAAIFSAVIAPHRSLSRTGFVLVMGLAAGLAGLAGLLFLLMGAWPVVGFLALDVALIWWAFRANDRAARAREFVEVRASELVVRRVSARGAATEWRFNPAWARLLVSRDEDAAVRRLDLSSRGRRVEIAGWLSPPEKADFAMALSRALDRARRGPLPV